ncbi:MAG TPA: Maf family protein [Vicinamibacterales bacterium]|nr:Maf family protein [Vicinamibacterales bacterium]
MRLLLASASPRRRELLAAAGISCVVAPVDVDERQLAGERAEQYVDRLARQKAAAGLARFPDDVILAADTAVVLGGDVLGKPADAAVAAAMLRRLSGRAHDVFTGVAIAWPGGIVAEVDRTRVWMTELTDEDIASYVATGEPLDKAGAYGIQGWAARFIPRIEGSYANVVGLPVATVLQLLHRAGMFQLIRGPGGPAGRG